jgi:hypothetical protein
MLSQNISPLGRPRATSHFLPKIPARSAAEPSAQWMSDVFSQSRASSLVKCNASLDCPSTALRPLAPLLYPCQSAQSAVPSRYPTSVLINPSSIENRGLQPRSLRTGSLSTYSDEVSLHRAPRPGKRPRAFPEYQLGGLVRLNKSLTLAAFHNAQPS